MHLSSHSGSIVIPLSNAGHGLKSWNLPKPQQPTFDNRSAINTAKTKGTFTTTALRSGFGIFEKMKTPETPTHYFLCRSPTFCGTLVLHVMITSSTGRRNDIGIGSARPILMTRSGLRPSIPSHFAKSGRTVGSSTGMFT